MISRPALRTTFNTVLLSIPCLVVLFPFYVMIVMSTFSTTEIFGGLSFLPGDYWLQNLRRVLTTEYFRGYANSAIISVAATISSVLVSAAAGYGFAKFRFRLNRPLFLFVVVSLMIPPQLSLIGYVIFMRWLGLVNTLFPLILTFTANAFGVFFMTQYMRNTLPSEILESGRIDGCSETGIFIRLVLPYVAPALVSIGILVFLWSWNNYMLPLVVVNDPVRYTVPLVIATLTEEYMMDFGARLMGLTLGTMPVLVIFVIQSKSLTKGLTAGAVKG